MEQTSYQKYLSKNQSQKTTCFKSFREIKEEDEKAESWELLPENMDDFHFYTQCQDLDAF